MFNKILINHKNSYLHYLHMFIFFPHYLQCKCFLISVLTGWMVTDHSCITNVPCCQMASTWCCPVASSRSEMCPPRTASRLTSAEPNTGWPERPSCQPRQADSSSQVSQKKNMQNGPNFRKKNFHYYKR